MTRLGSMPTIQRLSGLPFLMLLLTTLGSAALEKITEGAVPSWFIDQFKGSLLDAFPGSLAMSYVLIAALEAASSALLLAGLATGEFLGGARKRRFLPAAFLLSETTFVALGFGQRITHKYDGAFQLFAYAVFTLVAGRMILGREAEAHD